VNLRLFLFHTALGSGADGGFPPFVSDDSRGPEPCVPVFAISRGFDASADDPGGGVPVPTRGLSLGLAVALDGLALDARKVLLTDTALNVAGFFTDADRP
jgi:hypothetical protein